ncbi:MAG: choice-of-anchor Q domain-containing protein, partial [Bacteroidota bacterium]
MVRTKLLLIISLILGSLPLSFAEDITVPNGDVNALIAAIEQTNSNGDVSNTIILATDGQYTISRAFGQAPEGRGPIGLPVLGTITGGKTLIIEGNGAILERATNAGAFRFFYIELGTTVFLNNLTLQNGLTTRRGGGAIYMKFQARLRTEGCKFIRNGTQYPGAQYGGAIYADIQCDTEINNTEFTENFGTGEGGCIYNVLADLKVTNSRFVRNRTINNLAGRFIFVSGAAIFCDGANDDGEQKLEIRQCVFEDNEVGDVGRDQGGGACFLFLYNDQVLEMDRCTFRNNKSGTFGGALFLGTNPRGPTPSQNTFQRVSNCLFVNNESKQGGAIWVDSDRGEFTNCTITENRASEFGGAFSIFALGAFNINHCTIVRNFAERGGGGIFTRSDIELNNSIIAFNTENTGFGVHGNCRNTYRGSNNIEFPDRQTDNPNFRFCTASVMIADPNIGPLLDNGGPTETIGLLAGSPAIDAIAASCPGAGLDSLDQRGVKRGDGVNSGAACDIGAFEVSSVGVEVNAPGNLQAISTGQNQVNLTWIDNSTGETGFLLQRSTGNPFNFADLTFVNPDVEAFVDNSLEANTTYYYRIRAEGGSTASWSNIAGVTTFTDGACSNLSYLPVPLTSPDIVVGNGSPASCTPEAIQSALDQGGHIACDCGPDPITISISSQLNASVSGTVLDGGGLLTLDGGNSSRILNIDEGIDFTLQNIQMINGRAPATGGLFLESGGAILVGSGITGLGGGEVRVINASFDNNTVANINTAERGGGAIYTYRLR